MRLVELWRARIEQLARAVVSELELALCLAAALGVALPARAQPAAAPAASGR